MMRALLTVLVVLPLLGCPRGDPSDGVTQPLDTGSPIQDMAADTSVEPDVLPDVPAEPGSLTIEPESITFSDVRQGESDSAIIGLLNHGGAPIVVTNLQLIEVDRTGEPEFAMGDGWATSFVIAANSFRELEVIYAPKDFGIDLGRVTLNSNDPDQQLAEIRIETVSAYAQLEGPGFLRFGDVNVGDAVTKRITFYNRGLDALTLNAVELGGITGTFAIAFEPSAVPPTVLERDEDFVIDVTYTPVAAITDRGTITLTTDAPDFPTWDVALVGNDPVPCLDITPGNVDFGEVAAATRPVQQVTLLNCSRTLALDVTNVELVDDGDSAFALTAVPAVPLQLAPLQTAQFSISGTLAGPGVATGELEVESTDPRTFGLVPLRLTVANP